MARPASTWCGFPSSTCGHARPGRLRAVLDDLLRASRPARPSSSRAAAAWAGRAPIVGCLLRDGGLDGQAAIDLTRASRKHTIENRAQEQFVRDWDWPAREVLA